MRIYNTLSRSVEEFKPIVEGKVGAYTCGPTVYNFMHIGNLRTFVFSDILQRVLKFNGFEVKSVQNITDIDDKIINKAKDQNVSASEITTEFTQAFLSDSKKLNIQDKSVLTRATQYIPKMIEFIKILIEKEFAYVEKDGSVYFDISKFLNYGKLSGIDASNLKTGTRVLSDEYTKEDVQDFAIWKSEEDEKFSYDSPWGKGRPGWHIECSVMSTDNLGDTFDIHTGGIDLIFPHHENEIAQSEAKSGKKFVNYFVHGAHMLVDNKKMSKSLNNFFTLKDIEEKGFDSMALRYLYLQTHYRQEMNFTFESLSAAQNALKKLQNEYLNLPDGEVDPDFDEDFGQAVDDDLNMPKALSIVWEYLKSSQPNKATLNRFDEVLGLGLKDLKKEEVNAPMEVKDLIEKRKKLREDKKFEEADKVRTQIEDLGFEIEDKGNSEIIKVKSS